MDEFRFERQLTRVLHKHIREGLFTDQGLKIFKEVNVEMVIPDVVVISGSKASVAKRTTLSSFESYILADVLNNQNARVCEIAHRLFSEQDRVKSVINKLVKFGFVIDKESSYIVDRKMLENVKVVSIEAKLSDWRQAIAQAITYNSFSNTSYIAMPSKVLKDVRIKKECKRRNIGLISVSKRKTAILYNPKLKMLKTSQWISIISKTTGIHI